MCSTRRYRTIIKITVVAIGFLLVVRFLTDYAPSRRSTKHPRHLPAYNDQSYTTEQVTFSNSERTHSLTLEPVRGHAVTQRHENLHHENLRHRSTGEFHKIATTEATVSVNNKAEAKTVPEKHKRAVVTRRNKAAQEDNAGTMQNGVNMTVFFEESPDVKAVLPKKFLPDYKSLCWYSHNAELLCLPAVYMVGIPKCGTTDIYNKLTWHSQLAVPAYGKEHPYWNRRRLGRPTGFNNPEIKEKQGFREHLKAFDIAKQDDPHNTIFMDGTPSLAWDLVGWETRYPALSSPPYTNADLLHTVSPGAKIIMMLRDPVKRLYSDYVYFTAGRSAEEQMMRTPLSFHDDAYTEMERFRGCLEQGDTLSNCCHSTENSITLRLHLGVYVCYVREWKEVFQDNLLVLTLEEYSRDPIGTLFRVFDFLELDSPDKSLLQSFITESEVGNTNKKGKVQLGDPADATVKLLRDFYGPYNSELAVLLNDPKFYFGWDSV